MDLNKKIIISLISFWGVGIISALVFAGVLILQRSLSITRVQASPGPECTVNDTLHVNGGVITEGDMHVMGVVTIDDTVQAERGTIFNRLNVGAGGISTDGDITTGSGEITTSGLFTTALSANSVDFLPTVCLQVTGVSVTDPNRADAFANCPAGRALTGGGCNCGGNQGEVALVFSQPAALPSWLCRCDRIAGAGNVTATALARCCF